MRVIHIFNGELCPKCGKIHPKLDDPTAIFTLEEKRILKGREYGKKYHLGHLQQAKERTKEYRRTHKNEIRFNNSVWVNKNREWITERDHKRYLKSRNYYLERAKNYRLSGKKKIVDDKYRASHRIELAKAQRERQLELKQLVIKHYSKGMMKCSWCGFSDIRALTIDHIKGDGVKHRRKVGINLYPWLIKNNFPEGFQVLCMNCQREKENKIRLESGKTAKSSAGLYRQRLRNETIRHYTNELMTCMKCGSSKLESLSMDHINGGGRKHIKQLGSNLGLYLWIKRNNYPKEFQVICMNCQMIKRVENKECVSNKKN